jgi:hypothetical protein
VAGPDSENLWRGEIDVKASGVGVYSKPVPACPVGMCHLFQAESVDGRRCQHRPCHSRLWGADTTLPVLERHSSAETPATRQTRAKLPSGSLSSGCLRTGTRSRRWLVPSTDGDGCRRWHDLKSACSRLVAGRAYRCGVPRDRKRYHRALVPDPNCARARVI